MDRERHANELEERDEIIGNIVNDARQYMTDPQSHYGWLSRFYSDKIANEIIESAHQSLKELKK